VPKAPPPPVEEAPPEEKPEGDNVSWIPGYWAWDDDSADFLWVSGVWREEPPGRDWVPGEWRKAEGGYQWVPGYWAVEGQAEAEYLPPPPESLEAGPSAPAPSAGAAYVPGCWLFQANRYVWRPGHWAAGHAGWVWTPDCYQWTPAGYVYVRGFWDRPLAERGLLFAPVRFAAAALAGRRAFVYRPSHVVSPDFLLGSLFVRSATRKYVFGDYFDARHCKGYVPWVDYHPAKGVFDGNYAYYRAGHAGRPEWERGLSALYAGRYSGEVPRPPRTLAQQNTVVKNITVNKTVNTAVSKAVNITNVQNVTAVQPVRKAKGLPVTALSSLAGVRADPSKREPEHREVRLQQASREHLEAERKQVERYRAVTKERAAKEAELAARVKGAKAAAPAPPARVRYELPKGVPPPRERKAVKAPPPPTAHPKGPPAPPPKKGTPPPKKGGPRDND
jgi:hypothetical protein